MKKVGIVGSGDMGSGLAKNLIKNGFSVIGLDLLEHRKVAFEAVGGELAKDLTISLNIAEELEVPLHTASTAMQIFQAGKSKRPNGDNWACTQVNEEIIGAELPRNLRGKS